MVYKSIQYAGPWRSGNTVSLTADRKKVAAEEAQTRQEISELRKLLERSLRPPISEGGTEPSPDRTS
jgi:hypothetical protein